MATTTLIVEIVVMGILAIAALYLDLHFADQFINEHLYIRISWIRGLLAFAQSGHFDEKIVAALALAVSYPVGWAINSLGFLLVHERLTKRYEARKYPSNYEGRQGFLMQNASDYSSRVMLEHFSMYRIDRSFLVISLLLLPASFLNHHWVVISLLNVGIVLLCIFLTDKAYVHYKELCKAVESAIIDQATLELLVKQKISE